MIFKSENPGKLEAFITKLRDNEKKEENLDESEKEMLKLIDIQAFNSPIDCIFQNPFGSDSTSSFKGVADDLFPEYVKEKLKKKEEKNEKKEVKISNHIEMTNEEKEKFNEKIEEFKRIQMKNLSKEERSKITKNNSNNPEPQENEILKEGSIEGNPSQIIKLVFYSKSKKIHFLRVNNWKSEWFQSTQKDFTLEKIRNHIKSISLQYKVSFHEIIYKNEESYTFVLKEN